MTARPATQLVETDSSRDSLLDILSGHDRVALDTEFHAERRYKPELMLVQVAVDSGEAWAIDPLKVDVGPVARALAEKVVLVHSGQVDIMLMADEADCAFNQVVDVQVGGGMLGMGYPTRLDTLVSNILNRPLSKGPTLSDWSSRPLKPAQIAYAVADAQVLFPLADAMADALERAGRWDWVLEESIRLAHQASEGPVIEQAWTNWDIAPRLDESTRRVLTVLYHWRDQQGRDKNQPPHFILSDGLCLDIARRKPKSLAALTENRRIPQGLVRRLGQSMVDVVKWALENSPPLPFVPTEEQAEQARAIDLWARAVGQQLDVAPGLLLPVGTSAAVAARGAEALTGWRARLLEEPLEAFMTGRSALYYSASGAELRPV